MKELMAFFVLSLPILAVILIVIVGILVARAVARRTEGPERKKSIAAALAVLAVLLIPTWDEIAGRLYFHYLCATQGGVKILRRAELQPEYWGSNGIPKGRIVREGSHFETKIGDRFYVETQAQKDYSQVFRIDRDHLFIRDRLSGNVLSELMVFRYWGGWLRNSTSLNVNASSCPTLGVGADFYQRTFVKKP